MAKYQRFINDDQWKLLEALLPKAKPSRKGGRPAIDNRQVLEGILWVLRTGARWQDLPDRYPSASTCWRRLKPFLKLNWRSNWSNWKLRSLHENGVLQCHDAAEPAAVGSFFVSCPDAIDDDHMVETVIVAAPPFEIKLRHDVLETAVPEGPFGFMDLSTDRDDNGAHVQISRSDVFFDHGREVPDETFYLRQFRAEMDTNVPVFEDALNQGSQKFR